MSLIICLQGFFLKGLIEFFFVIVLNNLRRLVELSQLIILAKAAVGLIGVVEIKLIVELGSLENGVNLGVDGHLNEHLGINLLYELLHCGLDLILCKDVLRDCLLDILVVYQDLQS